ncbi:MAG: acyl-CoA dehydrogenase family protein, partial [Gammaproteobacteria bacterium]|nr:acyl-CoA dehydrogenase family protein [Gammaproteobacteria bacterium]
MSSETSTAAGIALGRDYPEIREAVSKLCEDFPSEYWRELEKKPPSGSYPTEFIAALTEAGYLAALIPEEYGGSGLPLRAAGVILETIHATPCSGAACHAQMY